MAKCWAGPRSPKPTAPLGLLATSPVPHFASPEILKVTLLIREESVMFNDGNAASTVVLNPPVTPAGVIVSRPVRIGLGAIVSVPLATSLAGVVALLEIVSRYVTVRGVASAALVGVLTVIPAPPRSARLTGLL